MQHGRVRLSTDGPDADLIFCVTESDEPQLCPDIANGD